MQLSRLTRLALAALAVVGTLAAAAHLVGPARAGADVAGWRNDYPGAYRASGFPHGQCTSFVAWRLERDGTSPNYGAIHESSPWEAWKWIRNAQRMGYVVDHSPTQGSVAVWLANHGGALSSGHVAYVYSANGDGTANIEEYNYGHPLAYNHRSSVRADAYIHFGTPHGGTPTTGASGGTGSYHVTAAPSVHVRSGPGKDYPVAGDLPQGAAVPVVCQARSSSWEQGSSVWDRLPDGRWIADWWVSTPNVNQFSLAVCPGGRPNNGTGARHF